MRTLVTLNDFEPGAEQIIENARINRRRRSMRGAADDQLEFLQIIHRLDRRWLADDHQAHLLSRRSDPVELTGIELGTAKLRVDDRLDGRTTLHHADDEAVMR